MLGYMSMPFSTSCRGKSSTREELCVCGGGRGGLITTQATLLVPLNVANCVAFHAHVCQDDNDKTEKMLKFDFE